MVRQGKGNTEGFLGMLKVILNRYRESLIELFVDHARWHKGNRVGEFLAQHRRVAINYIPKYHPELNSQEILWRTMRYEETTDTYYETLEELTRCVFMRSRSWRPAKILSLCHLI